LTSFPPQALTEKMGWRRFQLRAVLLILIVGILGLQTQAQIVPFAFWDTHGSHLFTWMGGSNQQVQTGIYGTLGAGSTTNLPGIRSNAVTWIDASGNLWLFGGNGYDIDGNNDTLNDLWEYSPSSGQWTWVSGTTYIDQPGVYGTEGTGSTSNYPGGRATATSWIDSSGNLWLFGGDGFDSTTNWGYLNDLWEYTPSSKKWTWVSGSKTENQKGTYGTKGTGATTNHPGGRSDTISWNDGTGNFWIFGGYGNDSAGTQNLMNDLWEYTVSSKNWTWVSGAKTVSAVGTYGTKGTGLTTNTPGARNDMTTWMDGSGNFWLFGGYGLDANGTGGNLNDMWEFVPSTKKWTWVTGSNLVSAGGTYGTKGTGSTTNTPGSRLYMTGFKDSTPNLWLFGGSGSDSAGSVGDLNDLWKFTPSTLSWTWVAGSNFILQHPTYGTKGVASTSNIPGARQGTASWIDGSGNFWFFGGNGLDSTSTGTRTTHLNDLWEYVPSSGNWTWLDGYTVDLQQGTYGTVGTPSTSYVPSARNGSATWVDSSGNLYLFGGVGVDSLDKTVVAAPLNDFWMYSPTTKQWTWLAGSSISGGSAPGNNGTYGTLGTGSTGNLPGGRTNAANWVDASGNFWLFGGTGLDSNGAYGELNDLWKYNPSNGQWTWISGSNLNGQVATYGTQGTGSTSNIPGPRDSTMHWIDSSGNLWLFGGYGEANTPGDYDYCSDLWKFNPSSLAWTWVSGPNANMQDGTYGTLGVGSTGNIPGGRGGGGYWLDSSGNLWLFGGLGYDSAGNGGTINDLWMYAPSSGKWTWFAGSNIVGAGGTYGTLGVGSTGNIPGARTQVASWSDSAGNFWLMGGNANDSSDSGVLGNDVWKYTPSSGQWTWMLGASLGTPSGVYNTLGVSSATGIPGGRLETLLWHDQSGNTWFFGGTSIDSLGNRGYMNDLWRLSP